MEYKLLGNTREKVSAIGLGSWKIGGSGGAEAVAALRAGFDEGITFMDTAEMYGTEPLVGKAIRGYDVFLATKVLPTHLHYDDVIAACDASLRRLGVRTIDLYQVHWPNRSIPISETMRAMERLVKDGKIRHIGVSNFTPAETEEARAALKDNDLVSDQVEYSILVRDAEGDTLGYCAKEGLTLIAYSPLAHGALYDARHADLLALLAGIGERHGKTPTQVALNWLIRNEPVIAIPKASSKKHAAELAGAAGWKLTRSDLAAIGEFLAGPGGRHPRLRGAGLVKRVPKFADFATWMERRRLQKAGKGGRMAK